jgi:hypothetical protein
MLINPHARVEIMDYALGEMASESNLASSLRCHEKLVNLK